MIRHRWILRVRNQLATLAIKCDSAAAIEGARMTAAERQALQQKLRDTVHWIDSRI